MDYFFLIALFVLGTIVGSFLNVVILRWNTGMKISKGRSVCFSCGKSLSWYELVPLVSFFVQKGACRGCGSRISWQYPLVELVTGIAFLVAFYSVPGAFLNGPGFALFALTAILLCLYIVMCVYDIRHKMIPDSFSYAAALVSLGIILVRTLDTGSVDLFAVVAGPTLFLFFGFFWLVSRGTWMGLGDAKLALSVGWALGFSNGVAAILLAFWIGTVIMLLVMLVERLISRKKGLSMKSQVPFGPFIILGFVLVLTFHIDIAAILSHLAI